METLTLQDGGKLKFLDKGAGRPIVLLHGWGMQSQFFEQQVSELSRFYRLIVPDLRGHGGSSPLDSGQGLPTLADDVTELVLELDLANTMLIGWSMGAMVAWSVLQGAAKDRVTGLVSIDMVPRILNDGTWDFGIREGKSPEVFSSATQRMLDDWPSFTRFFVPRIFAPGDRGNCKELADRIIIETEKNDAESMARLWLSMAEQDFRDHLSGISIPTLVIHGRHSQLYGEAANEWVANQVPNARRIVFNNSGHAPHFEEPEKFIREIKKFADAF